jgi:hypothetical protein
MLISSGDRRSWTSVRTGPVWAGLGRYEVVSRTVRAQSKDNAGLAAWLKLTSTARFGALILLILLDLVGFFSLSYLTSLVLFQSVSRRLPVGFLCCSPISFPTTSRAAASLRGLRYRQKATTCGRGHSSDPK